MTLFRQSMRCTICENHHQLKDECIFKIMTSQQAKCPIVKQFNQPRITEIKTGVILIDTNTEIEISDSCQDSRVITEPTIVEIENCTVRIQNYTFSSSLKQVDETEYMVPIFGKTVKISKQNPNIEEIQEISMSNLEELQSIRIKLRKSEVMGGFTIASFITLLLISFYILRKYKSSYTLNVSNTVGSSEKDETNLDDTQLDSTNHQPEEDTTKLETKEAGKPFSVLRFTSLQK